MLVYQRVICEKSILNPSVQLPTLPTWIPGAPPRTFISFVQLRNTRVSAGATEIGLSGSKIVYVYIYAYMYITIYNNNNNNKKMMIIIKQKNKHVLKHLLQNPGVRTCLVRYQHSLFICKKKNRAAGPSNGDVNFTLSQWIYRKILTGNIRIFP